MWKFITWGSWHGKLEEAGHRQRWKSLSLRPSDWDKICEAHCPDPAVAVHPPELLGVCWLSSTAGPRDRTCLVGVSDGSDYMRSTTGGNAGCISPWYWWYCWCCCESRKHPDCAGLGHSYHSSSHMPGPHGNGTRLYILVLVFPS